MAKSNTAFEATTKSFEVLKDCGDALGGIVPGLSAAAGVALKIMEYIEATKNNKAEFIAIGKKSCEIVEDVIERVRDPNGAYESTSLQEDALELQRCLKNIKARVKKYAKRPWYKRFIHSSADKIVITECNEELDHAMKIFGLRSHIEQRKDIRQIKNLLKQFALFPSQPPIAFPTPSTTPIVPTPAPAPAPTPIPPPSHQSGNHNAAIGSVGSYAPTTSNYHADVIALDNARVISHNNSQSITASGNNSHFDFSNMRQNRGH